MGVGTVEFNACELLRRYVSLLARGCDKKTEREKKIGKERKEKERLKGMFDKVSEVSR